MGGPGSGRKRQPFAVHKLKGSYRKDRHGVKVPEPEVAMPTPPKQVKGLALAEWDRLVPLLAQLKSISLLDRAALAAYCIEYGLYMKAISQLQLGRTLLGRTSKGTKSPHPLLRVANRALGNMLRIASEFGLTPSARAKLQIDASAGEKDPLADLLRRQIERRGGGRAG
jgi:P27 family predicted phage terminase small subunit